MVFQTQKILKTFLSITIKNHQTKEIVVWGIGDFKSDRNDVHYVSCEDEIPYQRVSCILGT